ncbi:AI-2E family transporter [Rhodospirillum centenum]|uniref:Permease protein, putative n=1 Tax=Rhodospirillum centenum (strain ATCC 51521 / SW) TaxID=414684 RepID=B6IN54_RHOCS|nr:AI-2E family transporter [Rhodospirillum centenum]ACI98951.1 permease protein, putative [Rhodospirillum centenum SW]
MNDRRPLRFWMVGLGVFITLIWLLHEMLLPFVAGMAVAYLLDPLADRMERTGLPRWLAATLVLLAFMLGATVAAVLLFPLMQAQIVQIAESAPGWIAWVKEEFLPDLEAIVARLSPEDVERLRQAVGEYAGTVVSWTAALLRGLLVQGVALVDVLSVLLITPVVAFYLLRDWDRLVRTVDGWLPRPHAPTIRGQVREVDRTLAGFVRGQATVCIALGLLYAAALSLTGLNFGLIVGLIAGLLSFIPYVGSLVGFGLSVGIAVFQYDDLWRIALVAGIFVVGQTIEGYFLTPKLVGERVGLHPVWVMFALLAGGSLFGFVGVLLAVPVAAVIGVLVRFGLRQYLSSTYYMGVDPEPSGPPVFPPEPVLAHPAAEGAGGHAPADAPPAP